MISLIIILLLTYAPKPIYTKHIPRVTRAFNCIINICTNLFATTVICWTLSLSCGGIATLMQSNNINYILTSWESNIDSCNQKYTEDRRTRHLHKISMQALSIVCQYFKNRQNSETVNLQLEGRGTRAWPIIFN